MTSRDPDPLGNRNRRAQRARQLPPSAVCVSCGQDNPEILRSAKRTVLNLHEPAGKANDPDLWVVLCLNCHELNTVRQPGFGVDLRRDPARSMPERLESVLRGLATFFELLVHALMSWADRVSAFVDDLDANFDGWRDMGTAQG